MLLLDSVYTFENNIYVCWECLAYIRNGVKFKERIRIAANLLHKIHQTWSLSQLRRSATKCMSVQDSELQPLVEVKVEPVFDSFFDEPAIIENDDTLTLEQGSKSKTPSIDSDDVPLKAISKKSKEKSKGREKKTKTGVVNNMRVIKKLEKLNVNPKDVQMIILTWEEVEAERQKALKDNSFTRHLYKCHSCVLGFNHKFKLDNHMKKHDESAGPCVCSICEVRFGNAMALSAHRRRHALRWRCALCGAMHSRVSVTADHVCREHTATHATHQCTYCAHTARSLSKLRIHLKNHMERQKCELCGKSFRDKTSLRTHLFIHRGEKEYSCTKCDKKFLFKKAMEIHMVTHEAPAGLYCHECDMNFKNQMSYYQHMKYNLKHVDPAKLKYSCEICERKFVKAARLEEHKVAVHLKVTPIRCSEEHCNFACSSRPVLRTHIRMIHRERRKLRNHVCHSCGKAYTTKKTLEGHMRTHTGERPFKCALCPSNFGYEAALYNHNKLVHLKAKRNKTANPVTDSSANNWN